MIKGCLVITSVTPELTFRRAEPSRARRQTSRAEPSRLVQSPSQNRAGSRPGRNTGNHPPCCIHWWVWKVRSLEHEELILAFSLCKVTDQAYRWPPSVSHCTSSLRNASPLLLTVISLTKLDVIGKAMPLAVAGCKLGLKK